MKITICGSIAFKKEMNQLQADLEKLGHEVQQPPAVVYDAKGNEIGVEQYYQIRKAATEKDGWVWQRKAEAIQKHFEKIAWCDVVLVANYDKKGIAGYVGGNTLMEMGLAFYLKKRIYLLNSVPTVDYQEEIFGLQPIVINGDLTKIV